MTTFKVELISSQLIKVNGEDVTPEESQELINHSPDGFNWGYEGSGPAQTALAILLHLYGHDVALLFYQDFKRTFIAPLDNSDFVGNSQTFEFPEQWMEDALESKMKGVAK